MFLTSLIGVIFSDFCCIAITGMYVPYILELKKWTALDFMTNGCLKKKIN